MNPALKPANSNDLITIGKLANEIWNDHYPEIIGQEQVDYMLAKLYSPEALTLQMQQGQQFYLVLLGEKPVGFIAVSCQNEHDFFLNKFYISSSDQRKGLGGEVFNLLLSRYPEMKTMRLQVNRQNYKAINFYFKWGFVIEKVADFDIGDGYFMNDFIMLKTIGK